MLADRLDAGAVVDPFARGGNPFTDRNGCGMATTATMSTHFSPQNAEPILGIVVGDALDEAGQNFLG